MTELNQQYFAVEGTAYFCKIQGDGDPGIPSKNVKPSWTVSLVPDEGARGWDMVRKYNIKTQAGNDHIPGEHIRPLSYIEYGKKPRVMDENGNDWPENKLIGNGTRLRLQILKGTTERGILCAAKVLDFVEYEGAAVSGDDDFFNDGAPSSTEAPNDDLPF